MIYTYTCKHCNRTFTAEKLNRQYCSRACYRVSDERRSRNIPKLERICQKCGKAFYVLPSRLKTSARLWCSDQCRYSTTGWHESCYSPEIRIKITCETCGREFTTNHADRDRKKFCSKSCLGIANGKRLSATLKQPNAYNNCKECGKSYKVYCASYANRSFFCSKSCNARWHCRHRRVMSPTKIEIALQAAFTALSITFNAEFAIGPFNIDIALPAHKVAVEADGTYWHSTPKQKVADAKKNAYLTAHGWTIVRFTEDEINKDADACASHVLAMLPP